MIDARPWELIGVVDPDAESKQILCDLLRSQGFAIESFASAEEFFARLGGEESTPCDLLISACRLPTLSGFDLCRTLRSASGPERLPIILISERGEDQKAEGIEAGADELTEKPVRPRELFAKIRSLLDIRAQEMVTLSELNAARARGETLSTRLARENIRANRLGRLSRFVSPQIARHLATNREDGALRPHRAEVTVMFVDLRGFTRFSSQAEPEEVMRVLGEYYGIVGNQALASHATVASLAGDGVMLFLNDPEPVAHHQRRAAELALLIRDALSSAREAWQERGYEIGFGIGLADGTASIGGVGFEKFWQYSVIGPVSNLAARLCQSAEHSQILVSHRFLSHCGADHFRVAEIGALTLKGMTESVLTFNILSTQG